MKLFRYKIDRIPVAIFTSLFILDLVVFFNVENKWMIVSYFLLSYWPKANICAWNHHHQHCPTFTKPVLNLGLEIIFGFQTGVTSKGWLLHHNLGHHQTYLDQSKDEAGWKTKSGKTMSPLRYMLEVASTRYYRSFKVGLRYPKHLNQYLLVMGVHILLLVLAGGFNIFNTLFIWFFPMINGLLVTSLANHSQHAGLETQNDYEASRNILDPTFNLLTGNVGYHTSHHINQGLHWSKLPQHHATIEHLIPKSCYVKAGFPYSLITKITEQSPSVLIECSSES